MLSEDLSFSRRNGVRSFLNANCQELVVVLSNLSGLDNLDVLADEVVLLGEAENLAERHVALVHYA